MGAHTPNKSAAQDGSLGKLEDEAGHMAAEHAHTLGEDRKHGARHGGGLNTSDVSQVRLSAGQAKPARTRMTKMAPMRKPSLPTGSGPQTSSRSGMGSSESAIAAGGKEGGREERRIGDWTGGGEYVERLVWQ